DLIQGLHFVRRAHALCPGVRLSVYGRRIDRSVLGRPRNGHSCPRYLFRHRPFPLHHGGRHGDGVHGRAALLVAADDRADVLSVVVEAGGPYYLRGFLPHLPTALSFGIRRNAAALSPLCAGISGLERDVVGRCLDTGCRLRTAALLSALFL